MTRVLMRIELTISILIIGLGMMLVWKLLA